MMSEMNDECAKNISDPLFDLPPPKYKYFKLSLSAINFSVLYF
jgi:hypothetical protein